MNESEKLELRRQTWEALGWRKDRDSLRMIPYWHSPDCPTDRLTDGCVCSTHRTIEDMPAIESSNGIAMDETIRFCKANAFFFQFGMLPDGSFWARMKRNKDFGEGAWLSEMKSAVLSEAVCHALIEAARKK